MTPAQLSLTLRPGITFGPIVFTALDGQGVAMDLTGWLPFAIVASRPDAPQDLDLEPEIVPTGSAGTVTANATTNLFTLTAHGLTAGLRVRFTNSGGALPAPITAGTDYYVISEGLTANDFKVSTTPNGAFVDLTTAGTGTHTVLLTAGQILIPEITDETSHDFENLSAAWDLILEDPAGKRRGPFIAGRFLIQNGITNPPE